MDEELRSSFRRVGKIEWVMLILMAVLVAATAIYYARYDNAEKDRDGNEAHAGVAYTDERSENGALDRDVTVTADEGYDLFAPSPRIGFAGYGIALSWESLEAGDARTIEVCDRYPVQEVSVEGGAYYHVS